MFFFTNTNSPNAQTHTDIARYSTHATQLFYSTFN